MEEMGLAQGMAQQGQRQIPTVQQIVTLLLQGMEPEELLEQGVPEELIMAAMEEISKSMQPQPEQSGLAATMVAPEQGQ